MAQHEEIGSVVKALDLLQTFSFEMPKGTISEVANASDLTRPTARRILHTFVSQGYMQTDGKYYWLTPKVLRLGFGYMSSLPFWEAAQPHMRELAVKVGETSSLATLDGSDIVYVARVPVSRAVITLNIGSRLPAHATSLGKAILAFSPAARIEEFLAEGSLEQLSPNTITDTATMRAELNAVRAQGYALNEGEREIGVVSVAAPILDRNGTSIAAVNVSGNAMRMTRDKVEKDVVPELLSTAEAITSEIAYAAF